MSNRRRLALRAVPVAALVPLLDGCATLPTTVHNTTVDQGVAIEAGPLYSPSEDLADVDSKGSEAVDGKIDVKSSRTGFVGVAQIAGLYMKLDGAPLPGVWVGIGRTEAHPKRFGWYPAIEVTGSAKGQDEDKKDGYLEDPSGNRYLYEIKRSSGGFGIASPQVLEGYPIKRFGVYFAAIPAYLYSFDTTEVEMVYERDRRLVGADPELDAEFKDLQRELGGKELVHRFMVPLTVGVRAQLGDFTARLAYTDRSVDSVKDYSTTFRRVAMATIGWVFGGRKSVNITPVKRQLAPQPAPAAGGGAKAPGQ
jgi:hypothetical protein